MSVNRVVLVGRLTRDPEVRTTTSGKDVATFTIAVPKRFKPTDGPDADFFQVKAFGHPASYLEKYATKGAQLCIDGRLETRKFTTRDGGEREVMEVVADNVWLVGSDRQREGNSGERQVSRSSDPADYDPFGEDA